MSQENVENVHRLYEFVNRAFRAHEFPEQEAREILDPKLRIDVSRNVFNPGVYDGIEGARQWFDGLWDVWHDFEVKVQEVVEAGDKVAVRTEMRGRAREGIEGTREVGQVFTFREGRLIELVGGMAWNEALAALAKEAG